MAVRKAFLSSTGRDLAEYRDAVCKAINGLDNWKCVRMEDFGARTRPAETFDDDAIRACDLFIGILGHCYGSIPKGQRTSYTEKEYEAAIANHLPRLMFLAPDDFPVLAHLREDEDHWRREQAFRSRVQADDLHASFSTPHDLAHAVLQAIGNWEDEERHRREEEERRGQQRINGLPPVPPIIEPDGIGKRLLTYPITYIQELFELISGPKRFVAQRRAEGTLTLERAFGFFALSTLILWSVSPYTTNIIRDILFVHVNVVSYGLCILFAWRLVGGTAKLLDYLPILFYYSPIFFFLLIISNRIWLGLLRISHEELYRNVIEAANIGNITFGIELSKTANPYVIVFGVLFYILITFSWFIAGWGAYRVLNGASRRRSVLAAVLFLALGVPIFGILGLVASALLAEAGLA